MEASSGPATLAGPTGPDRFQEPRLRSVTRISISAMPVLGSVWMMVLRSLTGWKIVRLVQARHALAQQVLVQQVAFVQQEIAAHGGFA